MITYRRILYGLALWLAFLSAHAWGQPGVVLESNPPQERQVYEDVLRPASRAESGDVLPAHVYDTLVDLCEDYPEPAVTDTAHIGAILNRVAWIHRAEGWGLSRKTGGTRIDSPVGEIAEDILQLPDGRHYDVLIAAGLGRPLQPSRGSNIGTIDLRARPWVPPVDVPLPWASSGPVVPAPPPTPGPAPAPAPAVDLTPVLDALERIDERLQTIEAEHHHEDFRALVAYIDAMIGSGPDGAGPLPPHVTDIKERLDVIRVTLEQLTAWLRSRGVLRW